MFLKREQTTLGILSAFRDAVLSGFRENVSRRCVFLIIGIGASLGMHGIILTNLFQKAPQDEVTDAVCIPVIAMEFTGNSPDLMEKKEARQSLRYLEKTTSIHKKADSVQRPKTPCIKKNPTLSGSPKPIKKTSPALTHKGHTSSPSPQLSSHIFRMPACLYSPDPEYPPEAREKGWEGTVILQLMIEVCGMVRDIRILKSSGYGVLDKAALESVKTWRFETASRNASEISIIDVPVCFRLENG